MIANKWTKHVKSVRNKHPTKSLKFVLKLASKSYKKNKMSSNKTAKKNKPSVAKRGAKSAKRGGKHSTKRGGKH